ncbi:MAG: LPS export ABC transporter ATP-binding protein [Candidatus Aminicenantes bacterium]|jgi:lipopolysaccharide export system ATP-binding protein|nr:LPS export ABC transporter ATP-binding protein [Candidatus Aminicenantes bacterium]
MKDGLKAVGLEKSYRHKKVVNGVTVEIKRGEIVGLLGPNGAGKTTTFSMILGLVPQDAGRVFLDGEDITELPMYLRAQNGICLLPQEPSSFRRLSVEDNLMAILEILPGEAGARAGEVGAVLEEFGLARLARSKAYTLSGGERRRLEIARAMITGPEFILLDEPFTGIDPLAINDLQEIILSLRDKGLGLLVTDHSVRETLKIADRAYIINGGTIIQQGLPGQLVASDEVRKSYLGDGFSLD